MRRRLTLAGLSMLTAAGALLATSMPAQAADLPIKWDWGAAFTSTLGKANQSPPGANDYNCKGTASKPPVVLVHGTWEHQANNWAAISPFLKNKGFCVFSFNYGGNPGDLFWGWKAIADNAKELATFVDQVRSRTGASKVNLVGHSQGGLMPRYYIKFLGGQPKVDKFVALSPSNHGTTLSGLADLGSFLGLLPAIASIQPAAIDQTIGSAFQKKVQTCPGGPDADICPGDPIKYTVIQTNGDQVVTPYRNAFLQGAKNITLQDKCWLDLSEHLAIAYDRNAAQEILKALDPTVTQNVCVLTIPYIGG